MVIQSDLFNESRIGTVVVAVVTSNLRLASAPGNLPLDRQETGLSKDSVVNVSQILTIDKSLLTERVSELPVRTMSAIDAGLRLVMSL